MRKLYQNGFHAIWLIVVLAVLLVGGAGYYLYKNNSPQKDTAESLDIPADTSSDLNPPTTENSTNTKTIRQLVSYAKNNNCGINDSESRDPFERSEADFIKGIIIDTDQVRASIGCSNTWTILGKNKQGEWENLWAYPIPMATAVVNACKLEDLMKQLRPMVQKSSILAETIDDNYHGGLGTQGYQLNTSELVKACNEFVTKNG